MPLAGRAREHGDAVHAAAGVGEQVPEPRAHGLADEMLLGAVVIVPSLPALADRLEQRAEHASKRLLDVEQRERLVEPEPDRLGLEIVECVEHPLQVLARRPGGRRRRPSRGATRPRRSGTPPRAARAATRPARRRARSSGAARPRCAPAAGSRSAAPTSAACPVRRPCAARARRCSVPSSSGSPVECPTTLNCMPEGDSLHRAAGRLQVLAGQRVEVETPHPRAAAKGLAERLERPHARERSRRSGRTCCSASRAASCSAATCA